MCSVYIAEFSERDKQVSQQNGSGASWGCACSSLPSALLDVGSCEGSRHQEVVIMADPGSLSNMAG